MKLTFLVSHVVDFALTASALFISLISTFHQFRCWLRFSTRYFSLPTSTEFSVQTQHRHGNLSP